MSAKIDVEKFDNVPAIPGPPVVVGTCACGGEITKRYVRSTPYSHIFDITCTKGGDGCVTCPNCNPALHRVH